MPKRDTRIALKHDIEANWNKAANFIPMKGEVIIYDPDQNYSYPRIKVGNGIDVVPMLPFLNEPKGTSYVWKKYMYNPILAEYDLGDDLDKNFIGLVYNTDIDAFPRDADQDGYWYTYIGPYEAVAVPEIPTLLPGIPMEQGSYLGTGSGSRAYLFGIPAKVLGWGTNTPLAVLIFSDIGEVAFIPWKTTNETFTAFTYDPETEDNKSDNIYQWYTTEYGLALNSSTTLTLNKAGRVYNYIVFAKEGR